MFIDQDLQDVTALNLGELDLSSQDEHVLDELDGKFCCVVQQSLIFMNELKGIFTVQLTNFCSFDQFLFPYLPELRRHITGSNFVRSNTKVIFKLCQIYPITFKGKIFEVNGKISYSKETKTSYRLLSVL